MTNPPTSVPPASPADGVKSQSLFAHLLLRVVIALLAVSPW